MPASVKSQAAKAEYANGVLKISIAKEERAKPKQVKVEIKS